MSFQDLTHLRSHSSRISICSPLLGSTSGFLGSILATFSFSFSSVKNRFCHSSSIFCVFCSVRRKFLKKVTPPYIIWESLSVWHASWAAWIYTCDCDSLLGSDLVTSVIYRLGLQRQKGAIKDNDLQMPMWLSQDQLPFDYLQKCTSCPVMRPPAAWVAERSTHCTRCGQCCF